MDHIIPLTNEILKAKPHEKDFTLYNGNCLFLLVKTLVKNFGVSTTSDREARAEQS